MNELGMQQLIVDAVNKEYGGFAKKLSHRFNVGVVDLLVKLPSWPAGVLEVKQRDMPKDDDLEWKLDVTGPQERFLRDARNARMPAGVASFTHKRGSGPLKNRLRLLVMTYDEYVGRKGFVVAYEHQLLDYGGLERSLESWLKRSGNT